MKLYAVWLYSVLVLRLGTVTSATHAAIASQTSPGLEGSPQGNELEGSHSAVAPEQRLPTPPSPKPAEEATLPTVTQRGEFRAAAEGTREGVENLVRGHLHVDLSLSNNVDLLARLAPLVQRLRAEQEAFSFSSSTSGAAELPAAAATDDPRGPANEWETSPKTADEATPRSRRPDIELQLSYHIFDMEPDPTSAPHCITGDLGRFCAFPPDDMPSDIRGQQPQAGGRCVVEEGLLQLCLAKATARNKSIQAAPAPAAVAGIDTAKAAGEHLGSLILAGAAGETGAASGRRAQSNRSSAVLGYGHKREQQGSLLWSYLEGWCSNCGTTTRGSNTKQKTTAGGRQSEGEKVRSEPSADEESTATKRFYPFEATCSRAQLAQLNIPIASFMENCETAAEGILQHQVENRLSVVPSLLINGKPALGELTAESVMKTLCLVAEEVAAAAASPGAPALTALPVCRTPEILHSPALVVKSFGVGVESEFIHGMESGEPGELEVAAHLLNTYARSPESLAAHSAAPSRPGLDAEGRYHFVNPKALRFLRKRLPSTKSHRITKNIPVFAIEKGSADTVPEEDAAAAMLTLENTPAFGTARAGAATAAGDAPEKKFPDKEDEFYVNPQPVEKENAMPLALDAPPSPGFSSTPLPGEAKFHLEAGKHFRRAIFGPIALKQQRTSEVSAGVLPLQQVSGGTQSADAAFEARKTETGASSFPGSATGPISDRMRVLDTSSSGAYCFFIGILVLTVVVAVIVVIRKRAVAALSPAQQSEPAPHRKALLDDKHTRITPRNEDL